MNKKEHKQKYLDYLKSEEWSKVKTKLFNLRGRKCEWCSSTEDIEVHHIHYYNLFKEELEDLTVLCSKCHRKLHEILKKKKKEQKKGLTPFQQKCKILDKREERRLLKKKRKIRTINRVCSTKNKKR